MVVQFDEVKQLLENNCYDDALNKLRRIKPQTIEEKFTFKLLEMQIITALGDNRILSKFEKLIQESKRIDKQTDLLITSIRIISSLIQRDRLNDASKMIDKAETFLEDIKGEEKNLLLKYKSAILHQKGILFWHRGKLDEAQNLWEKCLTIQTELGNKHKIASSHHNIGLIQRAKGNLDEALDNYNKSISLLKEEGSNNKKILAMVKNSLGILLHDKGELEAALDVHNQVLAIRKGLNDQIGLSMSYNNIGDIYQAKGELNIALDFFMKGLAIDKKTKTHRSTLAISYENIGRTYFLKGDLSEAENYFKKSLVLRQDLGNDQHISYSLLQLGLVYQSQGDLEQAYDYFSRSLVIRKKIGNSLHISTNLYKLIVLSIEQGWYEKANNYLKELETLNSKENKKLISQNYRLAKATVLKASNRLLDLADAFRLFSSVAEDELIDYELRTDAILNKCKILLLEMKVLEGGNEVLAEAEALTNELLLNAKEQRCYPMLIEILLLKSKFALLKLDIKQAERLLINGRSLAEEKGLLRFEIILKSELETLYQQMDKWNDLIQRNAAIFERFELSKLDSLLVRMIQKKVTDITSLPRFAVDHIRCSLFKMGSDGPETVISDQLSFSASTRSSRELLSKMSLFYTVSLGQGDSFHTGLFGPLPVPSVSGHIGMAYSFLVKDPSNQDVRSKGESFALIVFSMPELVGRFFSDRDKVAKIIQKELEVIVTIQDITLELIHGLKYHVLGLEEPS